MIINGVATILAPGSRTDGNGDAIDDWDHPVTVASAVDVWLQQTSATADVDHRAAEIVTAHLTIWDPTIAVAQGHSVVCTGAAGAHTWTVDSTPHVATTPRGPHHIEVQLRRVEG